MDSHLIEYLLSGKAWLLVGSGPSIEMGYPSWRELAECTIPVVKTEIPGSNISPLTKALESGDYPKVFQEAVNRLGIARVLPLLRSKNIPKKATNDASIYKIIAKWPIPVYLTTNYDDELQGSLSTYSLPYITYDNREDHMGLLTPELSNAIVKLHGDLRSETGLILTSSSYHNITEGAEWLYWRTKLTSIFQMNKVIVIGHSLTDRNIRHVLDLAKMGSSVAQPIIWIAPNVHENDRRRFLEDFRIRIVSYPNQDGTHRHLLRLLQTLDNFIPPRPIIHMQQNIEKVQNALPMGINAAAPGFFVFNAFCSQHDFETKRTDILVSAIQSALPDLYIKNKGNYNLQDALQMIGWPKEHGLDKKVASQITSGLIQLDAIVEKDHGYLITESGLKQSKENRDTFGHMHAAFIQSLTMRLKRDFVDLNPKQIERIAGDIESSLTVYFKEGGLTLSSALLSKDRSQPLPNSIIPFMVSASTRYDDQLMRLAFFSVSVDIFRKPTDPDRQYLGRISLGFFAFHAMGVFGEAAIARLNHAKETVWLIDSDTQINCLAIGSLTNFAYRDCLSRLNKIGFRLFTTEKLFRETAEHLVFANSVIRDHGVESSSVSQAAKGDSPYKKSNTFLEGFINWQAAGNPHDWQQYLYEITGNNIYKMENLKNALTKTGVETLPLKNWPGYVDTDASKVEEYATEIARIWDEHHPRSAQENDFERDSYEKAGPEAEALLIVQNERAGKYHALSESASNSWFISYTSIINLVVNGKITWQPDAFLSFASTLCNVATAEAADKAFEVVLIGLAQSGLSMIDDDLIARVFGNPIDQVKLSMEALRNSYSNTIENKYGESIESVISRIKPIEQPLAIIQLSKEIAETALRNERETARKHKEATIKLAATAEKLSDTEKKLLAVDKYKTNYLDKRKKAQQRKRRSQSKKKKK